MDDTVDFLKWLWSYLRNYKLALIVALVSMVIFSVANTGVVIYVAHEIFQQMENGTLSQEFTVSIPEIPLLYPNGSEWIVASGNGTEILQTLLLYALGLVLIRSITDYIRLFVMDYVSLCIGRDIRSHLYENIIRRPITYFEQNNVGDLISRLSSDIEQVKGAVTGGLRDIIQAPLELLFAVGAISIFTPTLTLFLLVIPACAYLIYSIGNRIKRYSRATQDVMGDLLSRMQERFSGIKLVKSTGREEKEIEEFRDENQKHFRKNRRKIASDSTLRPLMHFMVSMVGLGVLYIAVKMIMSGYITVSSLATFLVALPWIYKPLRKISGVNESIQSSRGAAERILHVFEETDEPLSNLDEGSLNAEFTSEIQFEAVTYSYPSQEAAALQNINLTLKRGKNLGLVGPSGAGKSTFTDLLLRFFDPTDGEIRLDGRPLHEYQLTPYRQLFGLVTQHTFLFDDSIMENIRYGRQGITRNDVERACEQAEARQFIEELPEGLETNIGERGVKLSGGERQRIALARALVSEPDILVLDEATSNVDSQSEKMIIKAIENLPSEITLVSISHAFATVQFSDEIAVLNDHEIEAIGTHQTLLDSSPTYKQLYNHQVDELQEAFG